MSLLPFAFTAYVLRPASHKSGFTICLLHSDIWVLSVSGKGNKPWIGVITTHESMLGACLVLDLEVGLGHTRYIQAENKEEQKPKILWSKLVCSKESRTDKRGETTF